MNRKTQQQFNDFYRNARSQIKDASLVDQLIAVLFLSAMAKRETSVSKELATYMQVDDFDLTQVLTTTTTAPITDPANAASWDFVHETLTGKEDHVLVYQQFIGLLYDTKTQTTDTEVFAVLLEIEASDSKTGEYVTPIGVNQLLKQLLAVQAGMTILDPTSGSAGTLLTLGADYSDTQYYAQEINLRVASLARINAFLHGIDNEHFHLITGDTLATDQIDNLKVDVAVGVPPFSLSWNTQNVENDPRFATGMAPKSKADMAFIQHMLYHLNDHGRMAIILPMGVLFRGNSELRIREQLVEANLINVIIGLPANLFVNTGIPAAVIVLDKHKATEDILFIDAAQLGEREKRGQQVLTKTVIDKITDACQARENVATFSQVVSNDTIVENEFNLNIPRYVDTYVNKPQVDIVATKEKLEHLAVKLAALKAENEMLYGEGRN